jgi:hypothetical protein
LQAALSLDSAAETGGQALAIKDVPSIIEGTGAFSEPEPQPKSPEKKQAVAVDEICNECQTLNGHTLDCKYHPANQQGPKQETTSSKPPSNQPKADAFNEAGKQEVAAQANPFKREEPFKKLVRLKKVDKKKSVDDKTYYRMACFDEDGTALTMICWHTNRGAEIYDRYQENGLAVFMVREKNDKAKPYYEVEDILSLAGKDYKDGKPIPAPPPNPDDDEVW